MSNGNDRGLAGAVSRQVAHFVAATEFDDLPPDLVARTKRSVLDLIGCVAVGSRGEFSDRFLTYFREQGGADQATVIGPGIRMTAHDAAATNGTFAHSTELSETYTRAVVHPGNVIIPALLAVGERDSLSGRDLLLGVAVGYETAIRLGLSVTQRFMLDQGVHTPAVVGGFGSAMAVAKLCRQEEEDVLHTLGIAACINPISLMVAAAEDASIKDLFEGLAGGVGVRAADLRSRGVTGIRSPIEDWHTAVVCDGNLDIIGKDLGRDWLMAGIGLHFKERALLAMGQPVFDAALALARDDGVDHREVAGIQVETSGRGALGGMRRPGTTVAAKASIPFMVAFTLVHPELFTADPHVIRSVTPDSLRDESVLRLSDIVEVRRDAKMDREFEEDWPLKFAARVTVTLRGGETRTRYVDIWPRTSSFSYDDVAAKFTNVVSGVVDDQTAEQVVDEVARLDKVADVGQVVRLLSEGCRGS